MAAALGAAYALYLLGEVAAQRNPPEVEQAEAHFQQALTLNEELGIWPLQAHGHGGLGQVVLLSGEAGIGKSRLVQGLTAQVAAEPQAWLTPCQCSPYYRNTALYPLIDVLERVVLRFEQKESPQQKVGKLEGFLVTYGLPLAEAVPLMAALLSLPLPADYAPLTLSPE
jgi:predicted ATPase